VLTFDGFDPKGKPIAIHTGGPGGGSQSDRATTVSYNGRPNPAPNALPEPTRGTVAEDAAKLVVAPYSFAVVELGAGRDVQKR
jgi:hypothetical protein